MPLIIYSDSKWVSGMRLNRCSNSSYADFVRVSYSTFSSPDQWIPLRDAVGNLVNEEGLGCTQPTFVVFRIEKVGKMPCLDDISLIFFLM